MHHRSGLIHRRTFSLNKVFSLLFALALLAPGAVVLAQTPTVAIERVALVTPASRTNQGWDQQAADALTAIAETRGITADIAENAGYDDITPILKDFQANGNQLIICHASGYQTICPEFAAEEQIPVAVIENPGAVSPGLVSDIETQAQEVAYLAGYLAGKVTVSGTIAIVVSGEPPTWNYMTVGFAEGLHASKPDATLIYSVIGEAAYDDVSGAKRVTEQALTAGADIIFGMGDGASFGMVQAVEEHNENLESGESRSWFIDVIGDKQSEYADELLTSVLFDYTGVYNQMLDDLANGTFGKVYTLDVKNGGVRLLDLPEAVSPEIAAEVAGMQEQIVAGTIKVSAIADTTEMKQVIQTLFPR